MSFLKDLYLAKRFYMVFAVLILLFILGYFTAIILALAKACCVFLLLALILDFKLMYPKEQVIIGHRATPDKLSNGDDNEIQIGIQNHYRFTINGSVIDEVPIQFQIRNLELFFRLQANEKQNIKYLIHPVERGAYFFGALNLFVTGPIGFIKRRFIFDQGNGVPVYPSLIQMKKYELMAISNHLNNGGIKMHRKVGQSMEFEKIREYTLGDNFRAINWKATARKNELLVNQFQDEKSQQVYCIIDKGRTMKMPFDGLSLLDYAVNTSLVISNTVLNKMDKAGLVIFDDQKVDYIPADKRRTQLKLILEVLYKQNTSFLESDFEKLFIQVQRKIYHRSLLFFFTNFESISALHRQLGHLKKMAKKHLLVVVFFENTALKELLKTTAKNTEQIFINTIAEQFLHDKKQMVKELEACGIHAIYSTPQNLTLNTINKYLELKSRRLL